MLALIGTIFSSVLSGGATGLLGILIQRFFDMKSRSQDIEVIKLNHQNALELKRAELEYLDKRITGQIAIATEEKEALIEQAKAEERTRAAEADADMFIASHESDRAKYLSPGAQKRSKWAIFFMGMVDFTRGMIRPLLTIYLIVITHLMFNWARDFAEQHGVGVSSGDAKDILLRIIETILYLGVTATVWWFGTRPPKKSSDK